MTRNISMVQVVRYTLIFVVYRSKKYRKTCKQVRNDLSSRRRKRKISSGYPRGLCFTAILGDPFEYIWTHLGDPLHTRLHPPVP